MATRHKTDETTTGVLSAPQAPDVTEVTGASVAAEGTPGGTPGAKTAPEGCTQGFSALPGGPEADANPAPAEWTYRKGRFEMMFPASGASDLTDPITKRTLSPRSVLLELTRSETPEETLREWASVVVYGPRRLKSGELGQEISSFHWENAYVHGNLSDLGQPRPKWLTDALIEHLPPGWNPSLLDLPARAFKAVQA